MNIVKQSAPEQLKLANEVDPESPLAKRSQEGFDPNIIAKALMLYQNPVKNEKIFECRRFFKRVINGTVYN